MPEILAVLPMRGGSKSIPYKSITPVLGRPLCHYTIIEAKKSKLINRFIVYTGDQKVKEVALSYGLEVPIEEKEEKQNDLLTFQDCLKGLLEKENYKPDIIIHLRATVPLRRSEDINKAIQLLIDNQDADSVNGVCEPDLTPFKMYWVREDNPKFIGYFLRDKFPEIFDKFPEPGAAARQNFPKIYRGTGHIGVTRWGTIMEKNSMRGKNILPLFIDKELVVDVDGPEDIPYLEYMLKKLGKAR